MLPLPAVREFLSNHTDGRPSRVLHAFKKASLDERRQAEARKDVVVWYLHHCDDQAPHDPDATLPYAQLALRMAEELGVVDLISWAHSTNGKINRLLRDIPRARFHLDRAIDLASSVCQRADAFRCRAGLDLSEFQIEGALHRIDAASRLWESVPQKINSDRGLTALWQSKALAHILTAYLHPEKTDQHLEIAQALERQILEVGCPIHAQRTRRAALVNLTAVVVLFDLPVAEDLAHQLRQCYSRMRTGKTSLLGAKIRWLLICHEIKATGDYSRKARLRLKTCLDHIRRHNAYREAALLVLDIASHDLDQGSLTKARNLLDAHRDLFDRADLTNLAAALARELTRDTVRQAKEDVLRQERENAARKTPVLR